MLERYLYFVLEAILHHALVGCACVLEPGFDIFNICNMKYTQNAMMIWMHDDFIFLKNFGMLQ